MQNQSTQKLARVAMLIALSVALLYFIHFPIFPAAPYLEYDPADIPIFLATFLYGPLTGLLVTAIAAVIQGLTVSAAAGPVGMLMHFLATGSFALVAGALYMRNKTRKGAVAALLAGVFTMTAVMVLCNLIITPWYTGMPVAAVAKLLVPVIIPFNLLKAGVNAFITFLVYKPISQVLKLH